MNNPPLPDVLHASIDYVAGAAGVLVTRSPGPRIISGISIRNGADVRLQGFAIGSQGWSTPPNGCSTPLRHFATLAPWLRWHTGRVGIDLRLSFRAPESAGQIALAYTLSPVPEEPAYGCPTAQHVRRSFMTIPLEGSKNGRIGRIEFQEPGKIVGCLFDDGVPLGYIATGDNNRRVRILANATRGSLVPVGDRNGESVPLQVAIAEPVVIDVDMEPFAERVTLLVEY